MTHTTSTGIIAWNQISTMTKMSVGARDAVVSETGVRFRALRSRFVEVEYDAGLDLYSVALTRIKRGTFERIVERELSGVFADQLSEVIYSICCK